jgi:nicotinate-nucleotide adenylyltransferase
MARLPLALPPFEGLRIGLFGGSFNPPHLGHRAIAEGALERLGLDFLWWLVSPQNPLKDPRETSDFADRFAATRLIARHPRFVVSDLESRLGTRTTADLLERFAPVIARGRFVWIMGADSFAGLHLWNDWWKLPATLPLAVLDRPGSTYAALFSPAAHLLARRRLDERDARLLPFRPAPAWSFLTVPRRYESSTALRRQRGP